MQEEKLQNNLAKAFKLESMSESEQNAFLVRAGGIVTDAAVGRLLVSLDEAEVAKLELYINTHEDTDDLLAYLISEYPSFEELLQEEAAALQTEAAEVMLDK